MACGLCGCHHSESDEHEHEHHHHEAKLQLTAYGRHFEIYAEATPFFTEHEDEPCELLTHVTWLNDFKPLENGSITATLTVGSQQQTVVADKPEKAGIFHLHIKPKSTGKGTLAYVVKSGEIIDTLIINDIEVFNDEHEALHEAEEHKIASPTAVTFTKEQSWKVDFATALPRLQPFGQAVQTVAQVQPAIGDQMTVVAKSNGTLLFSSPQFTEGGAIAKGSAIATVSSDGFVNDNLAVNLAEAKNNYEVAKQNYERAKSLVDSKIVSQQDFLEKQSAYENAKLSYENLLRNSQDGSSRITAPMSGYITQILVPNGGYVSVGQPIMVISQNKNIVLKAEIPLRYAAVLPSIADANIENPATGDVCSLTELKGRVLSYAKAATSDQLMLPITLEISNMSGFTTGSFVKMWLLAQSQGQAMVIPKSALIEEQGNYYVFVQLTPELFEKKPVKTGATDGKNVEVLSGLTPDQRIVTRGALLVKLAKAAGALDPHAGHVH